MRKLGWFNRIVFAVNILVALLTVLAYVLPFLAPKLFPLLSVTSLILPLFLVLNAVFFGYWLLLVRRQMLLSAFILLAGITFINKFYKFGKPEEKVSEDSFKVMSYNVRLLNRFKWIDEEDIPQQIHQFINSNNPEIVCLQEFTTRVPLDMKLYPHRYIMMQGGQVKTGQGIFSKYPILNKGKIDLPNSNNNVVYADIRRGTQLFRIYSMHLESISISPEVTEIQNDQLQVVDNEQKRKRILKRISDAFNTQQYQAELLREHVLGCPYPVIILGDMNNSAFSYVYRVIRGNLKDNFEEAGTGFGQTYNFKYYPARIDYIFSSNDFEVVNFTTFNDFAKSDHFPIQTELAFKTLQ